MVADDLGIIVNHANAQDHMAAAEWMRTTCHRSGHATTPEQMIMALAEHSVEPSNVFPAKHGISEYCSPWTIITGQTVDHNKHCQHKFGTCVQVHHELQKKNCVKECMVDAIHPRPTHDKQGRHKATNFFFP